MIKEPLLIERSVSGRRAYEYPPLDVSRKYGYSSEDLDDRFLRKSEINLPEVSEIDVVRHFTRLSTMAFGVDYGTYPLGSCTMKYNPKMNEALASMEEFSNVHPLQDASTVQGCLSVMYNLLEDLSDICGMSWGTLQPCAGAHGEYTGLKIIRGYFLKKGESGRNTILVPDSAHGTNPASAHVNGFRVVNVACTKSGLVDLDDLQSKLDDSVAALMLTNPNTLGLFEKDIVKISEMVHSSGARLYYDGANLNGIMGTATPGGMGFDVVHLNLHKTFSTPHGGGGPGSGPVLVVDDLIPFLPSPDIRLNGNLYTLDWSSSDSVGKVSTFWGNFLVCLKAYIYILRLGTTGIQAAGRHAVLNANYLASRLRGCYMFPQENVKYKHEFVISVQDLKEKYGVTALDVAKALIDFGYHPPTIYFPLIVHECLMFEPTETESKAELDGLADALIQIRKIAETDPERLHRMPLTTPVGRLDDVRAVKLPVLHY